MARFPIPFRPAIASLIAVILLALCPAETKAQETEYNMELGVLGGGCFYMGDANTSKPFVETNSAVGILARYNINPRMVVKADLARGIIAGSTANTKNKFPSDEPIAFRRNIYELGFQGEYNFFAYGTGEGYKDSHRLTPYILAGVGFTFAPKPAENVFAANFPIGVGVKYKLAPRLNVGAEWTFRFCTSDKLDVTNTEGLQLADPYGIRSGFLKNKDTYSFVIAYISYDLFAKDCHCND